MSPAHIRTVARSLLLAAIVALVLTASGAVAQTAPDLGGRPGIGEPAGEILRELRRMGFPMRRADPDGHPGRWVGARPASRLVLTTKGGRVRDMDLELRPIEALEHDDGSPDAVIRWIAAFFPAYWSSLEHDLERAALQPGGGSIHRTLLDGRRLRIDAAAGPTLVRFRLVAPSDRFVVDLIPDGLDPCRPVDAATGLPEPHLSSLGRATVTDPGGSRERLWLVIQDATAVEQPLEVERLSWGPVGVVEVPASRSIVIPGPPIGRGETLELAWRLRFRDGEQHRLGLRLVVGPIPDAADLDAQAAAVLDTVAIAAIEWRIDNEVCVPEGEDPVVIIAREHIAAAVLGLREIRDRAHAARSGSLDERLAPLAELRDWALGELTWGEDSLPASLRVDRPAVGEWSTLVDVAGTLLTDVVATRLADPTAEDAALQVIGVLADLVGPRVAQELAAPDDDPETPTPGPVILTVAPRSPTRDPSGGLATVVTHAPDGASGS